MTLIQVITALNDMALGGGPCMKTVEGQNFDTLISLGSISPSCT